MKCSLFHAEIAEGVFRISDSLHGPNEDGYSDAPGIATQNSYLVVGGEKAALIDLAVDTPELYGYATALAGGPVMVVVTHGHPDHIYHLNTVPEIWIHPEDHNLLQSGIPVVMKPVKNPPLIHSLTDGQILDLGQRELEVISLPGHTLGSVLLLDRKTGTLLTGDTCARRLLYGVTPTVSLEEHCQHLERLCQREFSVMYTAHDRCGLPKSYLRTILCCIREELPKTTETIDIHGITTFRNLHWGDENTLDYFDMAVTEPYWQDDHVHMENPSEKEES